MAAALVAAGAVPAGSWAADALRIPTRRPRWGVDTDDRTIPNEVEWLSTAVHLEKGCYRGQETVARVHNLGRPPRRLVMLNLDGSASGLPETGDPVTTAEGRVVGRVGTVAQHHDDGPDRAGPDQAQCRRRNAAAGRHRRCGHRPGRRPGRVRDRDAAVGDRPARAEPDPAELIWWACDWSTSS